MSQAKAAETLALAGVAENMFDKVLAGVMVSVVIGVIVALLLSLSLPQVVRKSIDGLASAAEEMSMGNLQKEYDSGGVTEFSRLAEALNRMRLGQLALVERLQKRS
jgi:methyl-accepting chemotaxis protein